MRPLLSRDGRKLVYAAVKDGSTGLKVRHLDTSIERWLAYPIQRNQLEGRATRDLLPNFAIAPDSRSVFVEIGGQIHRLGLDDASDTLVPFEAEVALSVSPTLDFPRRVETGPVRARSAQNLAQAADGRVAFSSLARIWVADAMGRHPVRLTRSERPREFMPAWAPDGRWIAFVTWDESGGHLWKARADGSQEPFRLTETPAWWVDPVWTPDGSSIVAVTAPLTSARLSSGAMPPDASLVLVPAEGGALRVIAAADGLRHPHFSIDPNRIYLSSPAVGLVSLARDGSGRRLEAKLATDEGTAELRISPDGSHLAAAVQAPRGSSFYPGTPRIARFPIPAAGLNGAEVSLGDGLVLEETGSADLAWSANGSTLAWIRNMVLSRVPNSGSEDARQDVTLTVQVPRPAPDGALLLRGAKVVTMRGHEIVDGADLLLRGNRIAAVAPQGTVSLPEGARVVDVSGKVIVPGFIDVHAHFGSEGELIEPESTTAFANLAYGITTLRNPQAGADVFTLADIVEADAVPGPRIFSTGRGIGLRLVGQGFQSVEQAREVLRGYRDDYGTHLLKWYLGGDRAQRQLFLEAARELEMMPTAEGGADTKSNLTHAIDGFSGTEHSFPVAPIRNDIVQLMARTGMTYTPTLVVAFGGMLPIFRTLAEERPHENAKVTRWFADGELYASTSSRLLWAPPEDYNDREIAQGAKAILEAGGRVAVGGHGELQGLSNHWEMKLLGAGGMLPHDILRAATLFGAEAIGYGQDLGSLEVGKLADLVVLDEDPLQDIQATQTIRYVMKNGVLYDGETLDQIWPRKEPLVLPWWLSWPRGPAGAVTAIDELVRRTMDEGRIPGVAVAVVSQGEVIVSKGYGLSNIEVGSKVTPETMFQSGSLGKQFTAAGIMALVEERRIDLDASIRDYLAEAPDSWQPITIRHLLTHSSGIPDYTSDEFDYETNYSEEDLVRMASGLELEFPAGARWNYSNTGYVLLGVIMGRAVGKPYWQFLRERIFDPAAMSTIRVNTQSEIVPHRAQGYVPVVGGYRHPSYVAPLTNSTADGSLLLSLHDLIAWNEVVANRRVLSSESWDVILRPMTLSSGRPYPYGFGWFIEQVGGQLVHQHSGSWQGFITQFTRFVEDDLAVIVLSNASNGVLPGLANGIAARLNPGLTPELPPSTPIVDPDPAATAYVGRMLAKVARGELELSDFAFIRQTSFPRIRTTLTRTLQGLGSPDRLELLARQQVGDDRRLQYWAWYGERRFRVRVSLGPQGGLTALRVNPEL